MKLTLNIIVLLTLAACQLTRLPKVKYYQYEIETSYTYSDDQLQVNLGNPLKCPLRIWVQTEDEDLQSQFDQFNPVLLAAETDTMLQVTVRKEKRPEIKFASRLGSITKEITNISLGLPFPSNKSYKVVQGNNTNYTHKGDWSRYALDFDLKLGDTVCAATSGFVVGVVDQYRYGGEEEKWIPYANFITIYEPHSGLFTQYVHLTYKGSLVRVGDAVEKGQAIALSGETGRTDSEHLHFNCLVPVHSNDGLKSVPFAFTGGIQSEDLKKGDLLGG